MRGKIYTGGAGPMLPQPPKGSARRPVFDTDALLRMPVSEGLLGELEEVEVYQSRKPQFIQRKQRTLTF